MLNKIEKKIMGGVISACAGKQGVLISPKDLAEISNASELSQSETDVILQELSMDGYFDLVLSDRHGEAIYCITLLDKGKGYLRSQKLAKRNIIFRVLLTVGLACISFTVGLILKSIF